MTTTPTADAVLETPMMEVSIKGPSTYFEEYVDALNAAPLVKVIGWTSGLRINLILAGPTSLDEATSRIRKITRSSCGKIISARVVGGSSELVPSRHTAAIRFAKKAGPEVLRWAALAVLLRRL